MSHIRDDHPFNLKQHQSGNFTFLFKSVEDNTNEHFEDDRAATSICTHLSTWQE
jgi:hypothetical protein